MSFAGRVLVYGGKGALGSACVKHFKSKNWVIFIYFFIDVITLKCHLIDSSLLDFSLKFLFSNC